MFEKKNIDERFEIIEVGRKTPIATYILTDKETGVQYLYAWGGAGGGLTPLLDNSGKVIVKKL